MPKKDPAAGCASFKKKKKTRRRNKKKKKKERNLASGSMVTRGDSSSPWGCWQARPCLLSACALTAAPRVSPLHWQRAFACQPPRQWSAWHATTTTIIKTRKQKKKRKKRKRKIEEKILIAWRKKYKKLSFILRDAEHTLDRRERGVSAAESAAPSAEAPSSRSLARSMHCCRNSCCSLSSSSLVMRKAAESQPNERVLILFFSRT